MKRNLTIINIYIIYVCLFTTTIFAQVIGTGVNHSLAICQDKTAWAWGSNVYGQLGNGTNTNSLTPVQMSGLTDIKAVSGGFYFSIVLKNDGTVWSTGYNTSGQLGIGTTGSPANDKNTPVQVLAGASGCGTYLCNIKAISVG